MARYAHVSWDRAASIWRPTVDDIPLLAGQLALYGMAVGMFVTMFVKVRHQLLVWVQRGLGVLLLPAAWHVFHVGGDVGSSRALRWYVGAIVALGVAAFVFHTVAGRWLTPHYRYEVASVRPLGPQITEIRLRPSGRPMRFVPGQFAFVRFNNEPLGGEPHPYSMASPPSGSDLRFTVKHLGDYTSRIGEVGEGAEARVEGPYGRFSHQFVAGPRQAWLAGGIGVAPFLSMAAALDPNSDHDITLFYGYATSATPRSTAAA